MHTRVIFDDVGDDAIGEIFDSTNLSPWYESCAISGSDACLTKCTINGIEREARADVATYDGFWRSFAECYPHWNPNYPRRLPRTLTNRNDTSSPFQEYDEGLCCNLAVQSPLPPRPPPLPPFAPFPPAWPRFLPFTMRPRPPPRPPLPPRPPPRPPFPPRPPSSPPPLPPPPPPSPPEAPPPEAPAPPPNSGVYAVVMYVVVGVGTCLLLVAVACWCWADKP
jgi:hypothetical protein